MVAISGLRAELARNVDALRNGQPAQLALAFVVVVLSGFIVGPARAEKDAQPLRERREIHALRTATSKTFLNADGSFTTSVFEAPVHYRDLKGRWRDVDARLVAGREPGDVWESAANSFRASFGASAADRVLELDAGRGASFVLRLDGAAAAASQRTRGNELVYRDVRPETDLEYVLLGSALKETLVLKGRGAPSSFRFVLEPTGDAALKAVARRDRSVAFYADGEGEPAFVLAAPIVTDSQPLALPADPWTGAPRSESAAEPGKATLGVERRPDGAFDVVVAVDETWLLAPERVFPVYLDPTVSTYPDVQDGYWNASNATSLPNMSSSELWIGSDGALDYQSAITFQLAAVPPGARVVSAKMTGTFIGCHGSCPFFNAVSGTASIYRLTSGWTSTTQYGSLSREASPLASAGYAVNWAFQPPQSITFQSPTLATRVQEMVTGSIENHGFVLAASGLGLKYASSRYSDATRAPRLDIEWVAEGVQVAEPSHLHSNGAELSWQHYSGGLGPYGEEVFADSPAAYWRLDDAPGSPFGVADWTGNGQNGGITGTLGFGEPGATSDGDHATYFDGSSFFTTGGSPTSAITDTFTIEAWIKRQTATAGRYTIFSRGESNGGGFRLWINESNLLELSNGPCNGCWGGQLHTISQSTIPIADTAWHHVAATKSGSAVKLYIDGQDRTGSIWNATMTAGSGVVEVGSNISHEYPPGCDCTRHTELWQGWIDEPAVYSTVLTPTRIAAHYAAGAELIADFDRYEVHRSATSGFTPSASTLVATLKDASVQFYRDTTARSSATFYYKVLTVTSDGSYPSNEVAATLPAAGQAELTIQPGLAGGEAKTASITSGNQCANQGASTTLAVDATNRALLHFDLRAIPTDATVSAATLSLFTFSTPSSTVSVHRVSADWQEGTATSPSCNASGATWSNRQPSVAWTSAGGDTSGSEVDSKLVSGGNPHWDAFDVTAAVGSWLGGSSANLGLRLKHANEANAPALSYASDEYTTSIALRPKLKVTYAEDVRAHGPTAAIGAPAPDSLVKGTTTVRAGAFDDGRVTQVQFRLDGTNIGAADTSPPFELAWDTTSAARGGHSLIAVATDDAGNTTTSPAVDVTVANSAAPAVSVTSAPTYRDHVVADGASGYWRLGETTGTVAADTFAGSNYQQAVLDDNPLSYWRLDETSGSSAADYQGAHSATYVANPTRGVTGALVGNNNAAVGLDGSSQYVDVPSLSTAWYASGFTIEAWVRSMQAGQTDAPIAGSWVAGSGGGPMLWIDTGGRYHLTTTTSGSDYVDSGIKPTTNQWDHVVGTWDGTAYKLYVNGELRGSKNLSSIGSGTDFEIGRYGGGSPHFFEGDIDEVAVYQQALSSERVAAHFIAAGARAGTYRGGYTQGETGAIGADTNTAVSFNGSSGFVEARGVGPLQDVFTIEAWVKAASSQVDRAIAGRWDPAGGAVIWVDMNGKYTLAATANGSNYTHSTVSPTPGVWEHVAGTWDGDTLRLYRNGTLIASRPFNGNLGSPPVPFEIGRLAGSAAYFNGAIDDVAVYPTALSAAQLLQHYTSAVEPGQTTDGVPLGAIVPYIGSAIPAGWREADGSAISRSTYAALFGEMGVTYGAGDGSSTFNLPDLRGRFPLGKAPSGLGSTLGATGGALDASGTAAVGNATYNFSWTDSPPSPTLLPASTTFNGPNGTTDASNAWYTYRHYNLSPLTLTQTETATVQPKTVSTSASAALSADWSAENPAYRVLRYLVKVEAEAAAPDCALWASASGTAPADAVAADGSSATGTLNGCIATTFTGSVPDLRGRFVLGQTAAGTGSTLNGSGGALAQTAAVSYTPGTGVGTATPSYSVNVKLASPAPSVSATNYLVVQYSGNSGWNNYSVGAGSTQDALIASEAYSPTLTTTGATGSTTTSSFTAPYLSLNQHARTSASYVPAAGSITPYAGSTTPSGWLKADGGCYSKTAYAQLFNAIGYTYGGSGATFCVPDLRGRLPLGRASSGTGSILGATGGQLRAEPSATLPGYTPQLTIPQHDVTWNIPNHTHPISLWVTGDAQYATCPSSCGDSSSAPVWIMNGGGTWNGTSAAFGAQQRSSTSPAQTVSGSPVAAQQVTLPSQTPPFIAVSFLIATGNVNALGPGERAVTATASDDHGVEEVRFYVDGDLYAFDRSAPFEARLDTRSLPVHDGPHTLTARAYDADGNNTSSTDYPIVVANTEGTKYKAEIASSAPLPLELTYDPAASQQDEIPLELELTNTSAATWPTSSVKLRYRWLGSDGGVVSTSADSSIGADLAPGDSTSINLNVAPPTLSDGIYRGRYTLRVDLYDTAADTYFATKGNRPFEQPFTVTRVAVDELGLERYQHYDGHALGTDLDGIVNLANGNLAVHWTPLSNPGRGLNTVVNLTYNSLESGSVSPLGNNWSLAVSGLTPFGLPLDIHPNAADLEAGRAAKWIAFTDGDGTDHRFNGRPRAGGGTYYDHPPGVHLYLRATGSADPAKYWALTKPDRTTFYFDEAGYPTRVEDGDTNALVFTQAAVPAGDDAYGLAKQVTAITDAGGRSFTVSYYMRADTGVLAWRGKVRRIADHVGHGLRFEYYEDGNLRRVVEEGGTNADGSYLSDRTVTFTYTTPDGTGPAIADPLARANPEPSTAQSTKLYSVVDARGNESTFGYLTASGATKWRLASITPRSGPDSTVTYSYDTQAHTTTASLPLSRTWTYGFDPSGRLSSTTNPLSQTSTVEWTSDHAVSKVTEPTGAFTEYDYDANGYLTDQWDQLRNHTSLTYENLPVDAHDVAANWQSGREIAHLSRVVSITQPEGNATPTTGDYTTTFTYVDQAEDHIETITDPLDKITTNRWNDDGTLEWTQLPDNGDQITRRTNYAYDDNGLATQVVDAAGATSRAGYAANGSLLWTQDPNHDQTYPGSDASEYRTYHYYDSFGRVGMTSSPKSTRYQPGVFIWAVSRYDANDNVVSVTNPHYGRGPSTAAQTTTTYDSMDRPVSAEGPRKDAQGRPVKTTTEYDAAGRAIRTTKPNGAYTSAALDFTTETAYDELDAIRSTTSYAVAGSNVDPTRTRMTNYCYDLAGDLRSVTGPMGAASFTACPARAAPATYSYTGTSFTTKFEYDVAHRQAKMITPDGSAQGLTTTTTYDANGAVKSTTDANGKTTTFVYDERGAQTDEIAPFDDKGTPDPGDDRVLTSRWEYDALGNVKRVISPRAYDVGVANGSFTDYVASHEYDALGRLVKTNLPAHTPPDYAPRVLADDPAGYWRLNEASGSTFADSTANNQAGTFPSSPDTYPTRGAEGAPTINTGSSFAFDGTNDYGTVADSSALSLTSQGTLEAWVKPTSATPDDQAIAIKGNASDGSLSYGLDLDQVAGGNQFRFWVDSDGSWGPSVSVVSGQIGLGTWHHVVGSWDANGTYLYVDGSLVASTTTHVNAKDTSAELRIGGGAGGWNYLAGLIDEVAVYSTALSASQIKAHGDRGTPQAYLHYAYDANGGQTMVSLPTLQSDPGALSSNEQTTTEFWDSGAIYSSADPATPTVRFDYTAEGWQTSRIPEAVGTPGALDLTRSMYWDYLPDGLVKALRDLGGQRAVYGYDADGNRTTTTQATGLVHSTQAPLSIESSFNDFDELTKVRTPANDGNYLATLYDYDLHGNSVTLVDNRTEDAGGSQTAEGRVHTYDYDQANRVESQVDNFGTASTGSDDEQLTFTYTPTGLVETRTLRKGGSSWAQEQKAVRSYYENGLLRQLTNYDGANVLIEAHTLSYVSAGVFLNSNRVSDEFKLKQANGSSACWTAACTATWSYDGRDRLVQEVDGTGKTTNFMLNTIGNVTQEATSGQATITRTFNGQQLASVTQGSSTTRYLYDASGNADCLVDGSWAATKCPAPASALLLTDYVYDYANRLTASRTWDGSAWDSSDYVNDSLDRPVRQTVTDSGATTATDFTYIGISDALSKEVLSGSQSTTKRYAYDAHGLRSTITDGPNRYSYLYDPHQSVSLLLDQNNGLKASYGYTAYGGKNDALTNNAAGFDAEVVNPYRYTGKRYDRGSNTYDMGARRYSPGAGRFLQYDLYNGALANLGLTTDPLLANRYLFTGANPINFIETDGHRFVFGDGGGDDYGNEWIGTPASQQLVDGLLAAAGETVDVSEEPAQASARGVGTPQRSLSGPVADYSYPGSGHLPPGMSAADAAWCLRNPFKCGVIWALRDEAYATEQDYWSRGLSPRPDGSGDAFRHAYWIGLITLVFGSDVAHEVGNNHEKTDARADPLGVHHWRNARSMDLHNNAVGREFATELTGGEADFLMLQVYRDTLRDMIFEEARAGGRLWVLGPCHQLHWAGGPPVRTGRMCA